MMTYHDILNELKKKIYRPVYLFHGEEAYFIDQLTQYIQEHVLTESEKAFNQTLLYGKDTSAETVINAARRYPMMASYQVVILKEAQNQNDLNNLYYYVEKPQHSTILVSVTNTNSWTKEQGCTKPFKKMRLNSSHQRSESTKYLNGSVNILPAAISVYTMIRQC